MYKDKHYILNIYYSENRTTNQCNYKVETLTCSSTLLMSLGLPEESDSGIDKRRLSHCAVTIVPTRQSLLDGRNECDSKFIKRQQMPFCKRTVPH